LTSLWNVTKAGDPVPLTGTFPRSNSSRYVMPPEQTNSPEDSLSRRTEQENHLPQSSGHHSREQSFGSPRTKFLSLDRQEAINAHSREPSFGSPRTNFLGLDRQEVINASLSIVRDYIEVK
jgi:hypothetical protein